MTLDDDSDEIHTKCPHGCGNSNHLSETSCAYCGEPLGPEHPVYVEKNFSDAHMDIIQKANEILSDFEEQGFTLTLRQLYYQFIAQDYFPNTEQSYKRLGGIINDARLAGHISFHRIEDRGRNSQSFFVQPSVIGALDNLEANYAEDLWAEQPYYVEVWVEKDALSSVIERPCTRFAVPFMACKGYMSASAAWEAGQRYKEASANGKKCLLIHLGDHDPSGIDMTRDNSERLSLFSQSDVEVRRVALNMDQVRRHNPPPNPAKMSDSRSGEYVARFGRTSWELDALTPSIIDTLITQEIESVLDLAAWSDTLGRQRQNRETLRKISEHAEDVMNFVRRIS